MLYFVVRLWKYETVINTGDETGIMGSLEDAVGDWGGGGGWHFSI
jgi:hypothetical protein